MASNDKKGSLNRADALDILDRTIGFINACDNKASIIFGGIGVVFAIVFSSDGIQKILSIFDAVKKSPSFCGIGYLALLIVSSGVLVLGLVFLILVLIARSNLPMNETKNFDANSKIFFGHIANRKGYEQYKRAMLKASDEELLNDVLSQIYINSMICNKKYKYYNLGLKYSLIGFSALVLLLILGVLFS